MRQSPVAVTPDDARHREHQRDQVDLILSRAEHLSREDQLLIEQIYRHGLSASDVARVSGYSPRRIYHKIDKILQRLREPVFRLMISHGDLLPPRQRRLAERVLMRGETQRVVAKRHGLSVHEVRRQVGTVRRYLLALEQARHGV